MNCKKKGERTLPYVTFFITFVDENNNAVL